MGESVPANRSGRRCAVLYRWVRFKLIPPPKRFKKTVQQLQTEATSLRMQINRHNYSVFFWILDIEVYLVVVISHQSSYSHIIIEQSHPPPCNIPYVHKPKSKDPGRYVSIFCRFLKIKCKTMQHHKSHLTSSISNAPLLWVLCFHMSRHPMHFS